MQVSAKEVDFQFAERSLFYAKIMQVSAKKVDFQFALTYIILGLTN